MQSFDIFKEIFEIFYPIMDHPHKNKKINQPPLITLRGIEERIKNMITSYKIDSRLQFGSLAPGSFKTFNGKYQRIKFRVTRLSFLYPALGQFSK